MKAKLSHKKLQNLKLLNVTLKLNIQQTINKKKFINKVNKALLKIIILNCIKIIEQSNINQEIINTQKRK